MIDEKYGSCMSVVGHNHSESREDETGSGQVPANAQNAVRCCVVQQNPSFASDLIRWIPSLISENLNRKTTISLFCDFRLQLEFIVWKTNPLLLTLRWKEGKRRLE